MHDRARARQLAHHNFKRARPTEPIESCKPLQLLVERTLRLSTAMIRSTRNDWAADPHGFGNRLRGNGNNGPVHEESWSVFHRRFCSKETFLSRLTFEQMELRAARRSSLSGFFSSRSDSRPRFWRRKTTIYTNEPGSCGTPLT